MHEKLQKICEEILQDENESKKFIALQTPEEMYDYFKEKAPELTEDEFDSFVVEALDSYIQMQNQEPEAITEALDSVSGGANFGKFSKQMVASAMAALSMSSAAMAATPQANATIGNINTISTQNTSKLSTGFKKLGNWIKNHKAISTLVGAGLLIGGTWAVKKFVIDRKSNENDSDQPNRHLSNDPELNKRLTDAIADIKSKTDFFTESIEKFRNEIDQAVTHHKNALLERVPGAWNKIFKSQKKIVQSVDLSIGPQTHKKWIIEFTNGEKSIVNTNFHLGDEDFSAIIDQMLDAVLHFGLNSYKYNLSRAVNAKSEMITCLIQEQVEKVRGEKYSKASDFERILKREIKKDTDKQSAEVNGTITLFNDFVSTLTHAGFNRNPKKKQQLKPLEFEID